MFNTPFEKKENESRNKITFEESDVVFVSDYFVDEYNGGAELSTEALFESSPYKVYKIKSAEIDEQKLYQGVNKLWVFFNFSQLNFNLLPLIIGNCRYFVTEYDYKFCKYRLPELHKHETGKDCDCHQNNHGKMMSAFFEGAESIFWMAEKQKKLYQEKFTFLSDEKSVILSSIFTVSDLEFIERLRKSRSDLQSSDKYIVLNSTSWIKGTTETREYLNKNNIPFEFASGYSYYDMLRKLSESKGLTFMPLGGDTCPRIVIEAKLLGIDLLINDNVQHQTEAWWSKDLDGIESYLLDGHNRFWNRIEDFINRPITLSGYTQAYNVMESDYPWRECIRSMLNFCDEVVVLDGGSTDGTWEELQNMAKLQGDGKLIVKQLKRNWKTHPRFALFDGQQKAAARTLCSSDWCWQMDIDEIVHECDYKKIKTMIRQLPKPTKLVSLPIIEYWGGPDKVRMDINPWKWRLSRNEAHITHGVPAEHRRYDENGELFSLGSDGCDYIRTDSYKTIQDMNYYTPELHNVRIAALEGNEEALKSYNNYMNLAVKEIPSIHHYSWFDIKRKIYTYKNYWSKHWASIYNKDIKDTPENNMFFDKKWSDVSDKEISDMASMLAEKLGGWIFHSRVDLSKKVPWITLERDHPAVVKSWLENRK